MPYSRKAAYVHHRQRPPSQFVKGTFKTVPLSHTEYKGEALRKPGAMAVVGTQKVRYRKPLKKGAKPRKNRIQSILVPKKGKRK